MKLLIRFACAFLLLSVLSACKSTRLVNKNEYLLQKVDVEMENRKGVSKDDVYNLVKQKPNRKVLKLFKFHLYCYNFSQTGRQGRFRKWMARVIGEAPVVYDSYETDKSKKNIEQYLINKGYYNVVVTDSLTIRKKKAFVSYDIDLKLPYKIKSKKYVIPQDDIRKIIFNDSIKSLIKVGENIDVELLDDERERITLLLKNLGYYRFNKEYIQFKADSSNRSKTVKLSLIVNQAENIRGKKTDHYKYYIGDIYVFPKYNADFMKLKDEHMDQIDTVEYNNVNFVTYGKIHVRNKIVYNAIQFFEGDKYNKQHVDYSYQHLSGLKNYRNVNINFIETNNFNLSDTAKFIDCYIYLTPLDQQSYSIELEGTNTSKNFGVAGNLLYQHKNIFRGAEMLDLKLSGAYQFPDLTENSDITEVEVEEYGITCKLQTPKFLLPIKASKFIMNNNPSTNFNLAFNYQSRPDYTRRIYNISYGYQWKGKGYYSHYFYPFDLNSIKILRISDDFQAIIDSAAFAYLKYSYSDYLVTELSYALVYNDYNVNKPKEYSYLKLGLDAGGNILTTGNLILDGKQEDPYTFFGADYAQFVRAEIDLRKSNRLNKKQNFVYRFYGGVGYPYGNSKAMPFIKQFYSGGAYSIRAWQVRSLGPGSINLDEDGVSNTYPNQLSDIKLEANFEYRFDMIWYLEGALFADMGNIWALKKTDDRDGAYFQLNEFYKQIAVGTGYGIRLDFSYFIFRIDLGVKTLDPSANKGERWILGNRSLTGDDFVWNFAIGYPF